nr:hypothetical protein ELOWGMBK_ELOWGMBK_CDS_0011 [Herelleviridae sp.]CAI9751955.1 hypothetical protein QGKEIAJE_QGKEIAJE_CDS_0010 [uncultured phage]
MKLQDKPTRKSKVTSKKLISEVRDCYVRLVIDKKLLQI